MRTHCIRCGECCRTASPTLHHEDLEIVQQEIIAFRDLFTLRAGEMVHDNVRGALVTLTREMIKVKTDASGACIFHAQDDSSCRIYEHRPIQCRELKCWDTRDLERRNRMARITRRDLVAPFPSLAALIESHEERFSPARLKECVRRLQSADDGDVGPLMELLKYDYAFRAFVKDRMGIAPDETDFLFGRPLMKLLPTYGLDVEEDEEGEYVVKATSAGRR